MPLSEVPSPVSDASLLGPSVANGRAKRRVPALIGAYALLVLALLPWATAAGPAVPGVVAVFTTGIIGAELATAFLLLGQLRAVPDRALLLVACAYLYSALMGMAHLLTFPGAILAGRPVLGGPQLASYVFDGWRLGFAALILAALPAIGSRPPTRRQIAIAFAATPVIVLLGLALGIGFEDRLPPAVVGGEFTLLGAALSWAAVGCGFAALVLLWRRTRGTVLVYLWLMLALAAFCGDMVLSTAGGGRFTLGWYAGRASGFLSGTALFLFFLVRFAVQQRQAIAAARTLRERTVSLQLEIARRSEAEQQLVQSQKVEAMGQLTGGIAHDFNNLLAAIVGNLDLLRAKGGLDARGLRWVDNALAAAGRGAKLTSQLLVFSRTQRLDLGPVVVPDLIEGMRELLTRTLGPHIRIRFDLDAAAAPVLSEATQLELAILNLALNARDAMPAGGDLSISARPCRIDGDPELAAGDYLRLTVADTGMGMAPDIAARAFDPFFTTKDVGKGTGLGLSQVFGIARRGGGRAVIDSRPGAGTAVHLLLRRTDDAAAPKPVPDYPSPHVAAGASVLVIDDDPDVRGFLADFLQEQGFTAFQAADGSAGLAELERTQPDLLIVDFAMPGLNGAEVARRARMIRPDLAVVFVTGFADTGAIEAALGPDALILRKPFRAFELQAVMAAAVAR